MAPSDGNYIDSYGHLLVTLTHGARIERGARGVLVGARGRRGEGGGKAPVGYIAVYVNIGPWSMDYINMMMFRYAFHIFHRHPPKYSS